MCAVSLQYDRHNVAAVKMLDAILATGLFTIMPTSESYTMKMIDTEMDKSESDARNGHFVSSAAMSRQMQSLLNKYA